MINRFDAARKLAFKIVEKYRLTPPIDPFVVIKTMGFDIEEQSNNYGIEA